MTSRRLPTVVAAGLLILSAVPASGQTRAASTPPWEVEIYGGGGWASDAAGGRAASLPAPVPLQTIFGRPTRRVSSWYFGDGALLLNQVLQGVGRSLVVTPLDSMLGSSSLQSSRPAGLGVRVGRRIGSLIRAEVDLEVRSGDRAFTAEALDAIEASRASFDSAWRAVLQDAGGVLNGADVTSSATIVSGTGSDVAMRGGLAFDLPTRGPLTPYLIGTIGVIRRHAGASTATLSGSYRFTLTSAAFSEHDDVQVSVASGGTSAIGGAGGGVRYLISSAWGIRADLRLDVTPSKAVTTVAATPRVDTPGPSPVVFGFGTSPMVQFRNFPSPGAGQGSAQSSLSGAAVSGLKTFTADGLVRQVSASIGVFRRF
jgi:hypothetical protein